MLASILRHNMLQIEVPASPLPDTHDEEAELVEDAMTAMSDALPSLWDLMNDMHHHLLPGDHEAFNASSHPFFNIINNTNNSTTTTTTVDIISSMNSTLSNSTWGEGEVEDSSCSPSGPFLLALPWVRITFGLLMVGENLLSLLALWHVKRMQTAVHRFITSLAVAELLMGVWCCYRYSAEILMASDSLTLECHLRFVGMTYLNFVAILSVVALCLDRCLALHLPFRYVELVTGRRVRVVLGVIWTLPLLFVLTAYVGGDQEAARAECSFIRVATRRTYLVLTVLRCLLIALIIVAELLIFRSARCQIVKIYPNVFSSRNSNRFLKMNAKAAFTTLAVVVPFLLLYFPVLLVQGNLAVSPHMADPCQGQLLAFVWLFASAHGLFTPLIFCWRFSEVRQNLVRLLCCARTSQPRPAGVFHLRTTNDSAVTV
ncbi:adenosine receptor A2b-like isoform X2 [Babylonia areolata]|uniref:adenosine receptor A2b-like isoform X2 n=1 Tax=Babylonia areolata TaxID=304850 RepID=UPI003FD53976